MIETMNRILTLGWLTAAALTAPAAADPRADLLAAFQKVSVDGSFQATAQVAGQPGDMQMWVILPNRFRMKNAEAEVIVLPEGSWTYAGGQWMKLPMDMSQVFEGFNQQAIQSGADSIREVRELGSESINGCASTVYAFRASGKFMGADSGNEAEVAICGSSGLPVRVVSGKGSAQQATVSYDFETDFEIRAPQ